MSRLTERQHRESTRPHQPSSSLEAPYIMHHTHFNGYPPDDPGLSRWSSTSLFRLFLTPVPSPSGSNLFQPVYMTQLSTSSTHCFGIFLRTPQRGHRLNNDAWMWHFKQLFVCLSRYCKPVDAIRHFTHKYITLWCPLLPYRYSYKAFCACQTGLSCHWYPGTLNDQPWTSECPDVKNCKWQHNPVWYRLLYSWIHITTVSVKGVNIKLALAAERILEMVLTGNK